MSDQCFKSLSQFEEPHKACCADGAKSINVHKTEGTCSPPGLKRMQEKEAREPVIAVDVAQPTAVDGSESGQAPVSQGFAKRDPEGFRNLAVGLTLSICFAANVGGVATINGAIPNMIMMGHADKLWVKHTGENSPINFTSWASLGVPIAVINLVFLWLWMNSFYLGLR
ncbi:Solute carrier family 13 member 5 [Lamellibrachia satsuma]|nr:Solute carrier family 13 member 5 [Lamellibrachia satsuma]